MQKIPTIKKIVFSVVFFIIILLLLCCTEFFLRLHNYGINTEPFIIKKNIPELYIDNQALLSKYHTSGRDVLSDAKNIFPVKQSDRTLRGFVIGGSTAQGYPYTSNQSFSKILELALNSSKHYDRVDVVNLGYSAMSSFYVQDMVKKISKYDPDFIIIYSGHNEYYGTVSATTGGTYFSKSLYLNLKEIKLFQLLFNLLSKKEAQGAFKKNLMNEQFNNQRISTDSYVNSFAEIGYRKNIKKIIDHTERKNIPIFFVEPISNLIDMPPFASIEEKSEDLLFRNIKNAYDAGDLNYLNEMLIENKNLIDNSQSALLNYIVGLSKMKLSSDNFLYYLSKAKDLDSIPFRAKIGIVDELSKHGEIQKEHVKFIALTKILTDKYGSEIFGNKIFIDHLHFNMAGQKILGSVLAEEIGRYFQFSEKELNTMSDFINNKKLLNRVLNQTEFTEIFPYWSVSSIIESAPYINMEIKFKLPEVSELFPENQLAQNRALEEEMFKNVKNTDEIFEFIYNYYFKNDFSKCLPFINNLIYSYPGNPSGYTMLGEYYSMFDVTEKNMKLITSNYFKALYLSDFDNKIYTKFRSYLKRNNRDILIKQLDSMYKNN